MTDWGSAVVGVAVQVFVAVLCCGDNLGWWKLGWPRWFR